MPAIFLTPPPLILVTGASGYIGSWICKELLSTGFSVRGTVREIGKGEWLKGVVAARGERERGRFEYVVVRDVEEEGAFDEAVKGVDGVVHAASPFHFEADDPGEIIGPAVKGTVGILESIRKYGTSVRRVVITSSVAAIVRRVKPGEQVVLTERDWNDGCVEDVERLGRGASGDGKYQASKTLAERAAWEFVREYGERVGWDMVVLNPPFVWGPPIHDIPRARDINTSVAAIHALIKGDLTITSSPFGNWIDVRDVAHAHAQALLVPSAGGQRIILSSGPATWQDVADAIHTDPQFAALPRGEPGAGKGAVHPVLLDTTRARSVLGMEFRVLSETAVDTVRRLVELEREKGW